ncbi:MAG TPA: LON peptidase substrate-binding domain-containing protein [Acidobacteriaceae bacterium]|nr:LON peptidase substrate-binding domain-containing protein [Acidobacteriaceae bacterium]
MSQDDKRADFFTRTPLFPLPNVVLFPRAVLPLHIFEERYKAMTSDALDGSGRIAMALLKPGWEKNYYGKPVIDPVVCVGRILAHERLPDGKYNFLLEGIARARVVREYPSTHGGYRTADLERLSELPAPDIQLDDHRRRLGEVLRNDLSTLPGARQFLQMLTSPLATPTVADLIAFHLLDDTAIKQQLLMDTDVRHRVACTVEALEAIKPAAGQPPMRYPSDPSLN